MRIVLGLGASALLFALALPGQTLEQAESLRKARRYNDANDVFKALELKNPKDVAVKLAWGRLMLEHWQPDIASDLFNEALELKKDCAPAYLGLALVSAGLADATWTLSPKHVWDVAAGVALVNAAGGMVACIRDGKLQFNQTEILLPGLVASSSSIWGSVVRIVDEALVS